MSRIRREAEGRAKKQWVVVAGTDTGVGKTVVAAGIARALVRRGSSVVAIKPVETGCDDATRDAEDGAILAAATGQREPRAALVRLRTPVTPALAADREGVALDFDALVARIRACSAETDVALVEGAGGLASPLTWAHDLGTLASALDARVVVVAADKLGTLNHVVLTVEALLSRQLEVVAIVLSAPETPDASTGTNADALRRVASSRSLDLCVAVLPRVADVEEAAAALGEIAALLA